MDILKMKETMTQEQLAEHLNISRAKVCHLLRKAKKSERIEYEDRREYTEEDVDKYIEAMRTMQKAYRKLDNKQVRATVRVNENKPFGVAYWGDWHDGNMGTDYDKLDEDTEKIKSTDGLYFVGSGDYKDNYISDAPKGGQFEQIIQPGMQDLSVERRMEAVAEKALALIRGCFFAGTPVKLSDGTFKNIEKIESDDVVFSGQGNECRVKNRFDNHYSGEMVEFETVGNLDSVISTADHKVLSLKKRDIKCKYRNRVCKPDSPESNWCINRKCKGLSFNYTWEKIGDLNEGDFLLMPKSNISDSGISRQRAYLYGLFLAEGSYEGGSRNIDGVCYTLSIKESLLANKVAEMFEDEFGKKPTIKVREDRNTIAVRVYSREIAQDFLYHCGEYAYGKKMSQDLIKSDNALYVVAGVADGDGHKRPIYGDLTITTISKNLATQLQHILINHGVINTIREQQRKNRKYNDYQINIRPLYANMLPTISKNEKTISRRQRYQFEIGNYIAVYIRKMRRFDYTGTVYDLEIEQDHSYTVNNVCVHNCHEDWDKKSGDRDFIEHLCQLTNSINLWHGGELVIKAGSQEYLWRCRHRYKYQSSLNKPNAMRRIMEIQGPCDVAAEAHLHDPFVYDGHVMGEYRVLLRSGSYKLFDEYGQKLAGYKGKWGVPVIIMFPDEKRIIPFRDLDDGIRVLNSIRK